MVNQYNSISNSARKKVLEMIWKGHTSHIASNFSVIDIFTVLYENLYPGDEVVVSKGWVAATQYYFLAKKGILSASDLEKFPNEPFFGLAETTVPGVLVSGGSMGHGLPIAIGMALGKKRSTETGKIYCIMSDGELNEGTTWESAMLAYHHKLDNLILFVDANKWQAMGRTSEVLDLEPIENRFSGFGWNTIRINGHDFEALEKAILQKPEKVGLPTVIICDTVKGKGVSFFEDHLLYHYKNLDDDEYKKALAELV